MFRSRLLKECCRSRTDYSWYMGLLETPLMDRSSYLDHMKSIEKWYKDQSAALYQYYYTAPCFYLGELNAADPDIIKTVNCKILESQRKISIAKSIDFSKIPFATMSIAVSTTKIIKDLEMTKMFNTDKVRVNMLIPIFATPAERSKITTQHLELAHHWTIETPIIEIFPENKCTSEYVILPVNILLLENNEEYLVGITTPNFVPKDMGSLSNSSSFLINTSLRLTLYFLNLLSCKNTVVRDWCPNSRKKQNNKHHRPELEYKVINITLPRKKVIYRNGKETNELPFHERSKYGTVTSRRGHFKTYTADAPLLGKHVGTYYWPEITDVKGEGITYNVKIEKH